MNKEVEEIVKLKKSSIVDMALKFLDSNVTEENFHIIKVRASSKEVYVSLRNPVKYLPINTAFNCDVEVWLIEKAISYNNIHNPTENINHALQLPFYKETKEGKKIIEFIFKSIGISDPQIIANFEDDMIIRENKMYYDIKVTSLYQDSWYKIEKETGRLYDEGHGHLEPAPINMDNTIEEFIEINN